MSDENFQDRLRRISANSKHQQPMAEGTDHASRARPQKPNYRLVGAGGAIMVLGIQAVKFVNENYQSLKDSSGAYAGLGLGLAGIVVFLIGIVVIVRGCSRMLAANTSAPDSQYSASVAKAKRKPSKVAQVFFSLLGIVLGTVACLYMFMASAALLIETETAQVFSKGGFLIAGLLGLVSMLFGLISLFLRGYALGRVPFYFLISAILTFVIIRGFKIDTLSWLQSTALLQ